VALAALLCEALPCVAVAAPLCEALAPPLYVALAMLRRMARDLPLCIGLAAALPWCQPCRLKCPPDAEEADRGQLCTPRPCIHCSYSLVYSSLTPNSFWRVLSLLTAPVNRNIFVSH